MVGTRGRYPVAHNNTDYLKDCVRDALAILDAIDEGELLAALPERPADRRRHQTAVTLICMMEDRLQTGLALSG